MRLWNRQIRVTLCFIKGFINGGCSEKKNKKENKNFLLILETIYYLVVVFRYVIHKNG